MKNIYFYLFFLTASFTFAQSNVSGIVTDSNGVGIPGVNVIEQGTTNGTTSDFDGNYSITVNANSTLVFSYVGYSTTKEPVNGRAQINVTMVDGAALDEVILVGSRSPKRTAVDTAVAIDVIDVAELTTQVGKVELN